MKIALIGTYPPPYGGRSIHVQRLKEQLEKKGMNVVVYNIGGELDNTENEIIYVKHKKLWLLRFFFFAKEDIIHYHSSNWIERAIVGLMSSLGKKTIVTLHSSVTLKDNYTKGKWFKKRLIELGIKKTSFVIAVNPKIKDMVVSLGVPKERVVVIQSYLPPVVKKEDISEIPQSVWNFIDNHNPIITANAYKIVFYNNQDLYGIDMCIDLCANLKQSYPNIGFVFCLPDIGDYDYFNKMKRRINEKGIKDNFFFQTKPCQLYPIIMKSDVFVRPTNTDGYGVSIAEALAFKVPAIASEVCLRPGGTILFKSRDMYDFENNVRDVLDNYSEHKKRVAEIREEGNAEKILSVYKKVYGV